jgi:two-component system, cell cycle sensor histidine kinase and response regulator CckA
VLVDRDGTIKALNRTAEEWAARILGRRPAEGENIHGFIPEAAPPFERALNGEGSTIELAVRDTEGVERWFETTNVPVTDEAGTVIGVCLNARDVSERKRGEQALRESEERYRDLFDNASDLVCMTAPDGEFRYVNKAFQQTLGYSQADIELYRLPELIHPDSRDRYHEMVARAVAGESPRHVELLFVTSGGATVTVEGNLSCHRVNGKPGTIRGIYRDITERKRVEEHLRRTERIQAAGRLAGGVAHEVNNMMTGVIGFAQFLLRALDSDDQRRADVEQIIRAGNRAADVTRQLLAFTRQQVLRPKVLDLNAVVEGMAKMLRRSLGEQHELELRLSQEAGQVRADDAQLEQVLLNLVLNSRDALGEQERGRVTIATAAVALDEVYAQRHREVRIATGPYVVLTVSDTGCGMDRELQTRIFEPFFTTKEVGHGSGLGLSTVYGITKQSGGFIWVYSEPGEGSTFKIYLPAVAAEPPEGNDAVESPPEGGSETILVVEDEDVVRTLVARGLRDQGYQVLEAPDGSAALRCVKESVSPVRLVISDVVMPEMGGRELGRLLAHFDPSLPVLYISGYTGEDVVRRGLLDPGAPFQSKPVTPEQLGRKVREILDRKTAPA